MLHGQIPYEILFGEQLTYDRIWMFGCLYYAHKGTRCRNKFYERATRCLFLGFPYGQKGWKVFDLEREEYFVSSNIVFNEDVFPCESNSDVGPSNLISSTPSPGIIEDDIVDAVLVPAVGVRGAHVFLPWMLTHLHLYFW